MKDTENKQKPKKVIDVSVDQDTYILAYITLWNGMLKLSNTDMGLLIEILKRYLSLKKTGISETEISNLLFSTKSRREMMDKINVKEHMFNNRIYSLKKKGIIVEKNKNYYIDKRVIPVESVTFNFNVK